MVKNLEHLTIHQFRGLKNLELRDLGTINLLVGANNSGKTSVLEAIATYCRPLDPKAWLNTAWSREIKLSRKPQLDALRWLFPQSGQERAGDLYTGEIITSGEGHFSLRESRAIYEEIEGTLDQQEQNNLESEEDIGDEIISGDYIERGANFSLIAKTEIDQGELFNKPSQLLDQKESIQLWESERRHVFRKNRSDLALPVELILPFSHRAEQLQVESLSNAIEQQFKSEIIDLLRNLDQGIVGLEILSTSRDRKERLYIDHKDIGIAPLSAFGDGIRRLLYIASTLVQAKGGVLLIDEIESSIHTEVLDPSFTWLIKSCQDMEVQLFATTHSLEAVDAILSSTERAQNCNDRRFFDDLVLYRLEVNNGNHIARHFNAEKLHILREELGQEVRW
ncbi:MAG: AAA family ATPase [Cyanobacteria bacterium]|jgi:AAA15 family ATPase/GTPase|nr:AAA family ATPase [Cyanobacteria bacterium GSL.Bin1]